MSGTAIRTVWLRGVAYDSEDGLGDLEESAGNIYRVAPLWVSEDATTVVTNGRVFRRRVGAS